jgi:hypothetical protein
MIKTNNIEPQQVFLYFLSPILPILAFWALVTKEEKEKVSGERRNRRVDDAGVSLSRSVVDYSSRIRR